MSVVSGDRTAEKSTTRLVDFVAGVVRQRLILSMVALVLLSVFGASYLTFVSLQVDPFDSPYVVRVHLAQSGGLLPGRDVTVRGVRVGKVSSVDIGDGGVVAVASIDSDTRIPADTTARVASLSAAGEQYLDFVPSAESGPDLADGAVIGAARTSTPVTLPDVLANANGLFAQMDPNKLHAIVTELGAGEQAPDKLAAIIDGGTFLISTLSSVLPETVTLLNTSPVLLRTVSDFGPGMKAIATELDKSLTGIESMSGGFADLTGIAPVALQSMDQIIADNSPTMVQLLGSLTTLSQMTYLRVPAMQELFFPTGRAGSAADAVAAAVHDGKIWATVNIYPREQCDYDVPRLPATVPDFPEPYMYADCTDPNPDILVRGARNAPRPASSDTTYPPIGADPLAVTDPTPVGPWTIPSPYGGTPAPVYVPPK